MVATAFVPAPGFWRDGDPRLALNPLVPNVGPSMERVEFFGSGGLLRRPSRMSTRTTPLVVVLS